MASPRQERAEVDRDGRPNAVSSCQAPRPGPLADNGLRAERACKPLWRRIFSWRWLRRVIALAFVTAALWLLVFPAVYPVSSRAVLNARIAQVRASIDGVTVRLNRDIGERVQAGEALLAVGNPQATRLHLASLETHRAELLARTRRLRSELEEVTRAEAESRAALKRYREAVVASLEASIQETRARKEMAQASYDAAHKQAEMGRHLSDRNAIAAMDSINFRAKEQVARKSVEVEEFGLRKLDALLRAARVDAYVQVTPYFQQHAEELAAKIPDLKIRLQEASDLLKATEAELRQARAHVERLSHAEVNAPVSGVVWARYAYIGQKVKENERVFDIADSKTVFVEALFHQRYLTSVGPGCQASINLTGGPTLIGTVRAVRTRGPMDKEPSFAVRVPDDDLKQVRLVIDFDAGPESAALIGRHVRVLLTPAAPSWFDEAIAWLFSHLRV